MSPQAEQIALLDLLVEAYRRTEKQRREPFDGLMVGDGYELLLSHPGLPNLQYGAHPTDLHELALRGLIYVSEKQPTRWRFDLSSRAFEVYERNKRAQTSPVARVEGTAHRYLNAEFAVRHAQAFASWQQAETLLWGRDAENFTAIGHHCREATQAFATSLLKHFPNPDADPQPTATKNRVAAVLAVHGKTGKRRRAFLDRLGETWSAAVDLCQRQEHGGAAEGDPLTWDDARRVVFMTLVLMTEIDSALNSG